MKSDTNKAGAAKEETLDELLKQYPKFERLAKETEDMRVLVDSLQHDDADDALRVMFEVDTNMLSLVNYHIKLSTACLKLNCKEPNNN